MSNLYGMSPDIVRNSISERCGLTAPQLGSWLKVLNVLRNYVAHHNRTYNRVFSITPKLPEGNSDFEKIGKSSNRLFMQLTMIRYLSKKLTICRPDGFSELLETFPRTPLLTLRVTGAPEDWRALSLWG